MGISSKIRTASHLYSKGGFGVILMTTANQYDREREKQLLRSWWGFERCTVDHDIELIYLPASEVGYVDEFKGLPQRGREAVIGEAKGGWDQFRRPFEESQIYRSLRERFVNGKDWEQTPAYKDAYEKIQAGRREWRAETIEELHRRTEYLDELYEELRENGFKSQLELYQKNEGSARIYQNRMGDMLVPNELRIAIDRDGEIIRTTHGLHRISIMKILKREDPIPAIIQFKHRRFDGELEYDSEVLDITHPLVDHSPVT